MDDVIITQEAEIIYHVCNPAFSIFSLVLIFQDDIDELNKAELEKIWPSTDDDHVTPASEWNPFLSNLSRKHEREEIANGECYSAIDPQLDDFDVGPASSVGRGMPRLPDSVATSTTTVAKSSMAVPKSVASSATMISTASKPSGQHGKHVPPVPSDINKQGAMGDAAQTNISTKNESSPFTGFSMDDNLLEGSQSKPLEWGDNFGKLGLPPAEKASRQPSLDNKWSKQDAGSHLQGAGDSPEKVTNSFGKSVISEAQAVYDDPAIMKVIIVL